MTRLFAFLLGGVIGGTAVALTFVWLSPVPIVQLTLSWPSTGASQQPAVPAQSSSRRLAPLPRAAVTTVPAPEPIAPSQQPTAKTLAPAAPVSPIELPGDHSDVPTAVAAEPPSLLIPVAGVPAITLYDTFNQSRGGERRHEAIDIMAPLGTEVLAASDGRVAKLFTSVRGGLTIYQFDPSETYAYYYAHLDAYAPGLAEGQMLSRGQVIGTVGSSGNAGAAGPHLHFAVFLLGPERHWWQGVAINPYPLLGKD